MFEKITVKIREFVIIYKKILLITVCFLQFYNAKLQSLILLMVSGLYLLITHSKQPFLTKDQNDLENSSNISSFLIVLVYNLLIVDIQQSFKVILIICLFFFSCIFFLIWIASTFDIIFMAHLTFFRVKIPRFYKFYVGTKLFLSLYSSKKSFSNSLILQNSHDRETEINEIKPKTGKKLKIAAKTKKAMKKIIGFLSEI